MKTERQIDQETKAIVAEIPEVVEHFKEYQRFRARAVARTALREVGVLEGFTTYMEVKLKGVSDE